MDNTNKEIYYVQNPSLGASILWRFVCGYYKNNNQLTPFPLLFIILPLVFRQDLCDIILSTRKGSGLSKVSEKLFLNKSNDRLYYVHNAADQQKDLTLSAIRIGMVSRLFAVDINTAMVIPLSQSDKKGIATSTKKLFDAAEKLGGWCADLTLHEISTILKVRF